MQSISLLLLSLLLLVTLAYGSASKNLKILIFYFCIFIWSDLKILNNLSKIFFI